MPDEIQQMAFEIMNPVQKARFEDHREADLAYGIAGLGRFRVNVFQQRGTVGIVFRAGDEDPVAESDERGGQQRE